MVDTEHVGSSLNDLNLVSIVIAEIRPAVSVTYKTVAEYLFPILPFTAGTVSSSESIALQQMPLYTASKSPFDFYYGKNVSVTHPPSMTLNTKSLQWLQSVSNGRVWNFYQQCCQLAVETNNDSSRQQDGTFKPPAKIISNPSLQWDTEQEMPKPLCAMSLKNMCLAVMNIISELGEIKHTTKCIVEWVAKPAIVDLRTIFNIVDLAISSGWVNNSDPRIDWGLRQCPQVCLETMLRRITRLTAQTKDQVYLFLLNWAANIDKNNESPLRTNNNGHFAVDDAHYQCQIYAIILHFESIVLKPLLTQQLESLNISKASSTEKYAENQEMEKGDCKQKCTKKRTYNNSLLPTITATTSLANEQTQSLLPEETLRYSTSSSKTSPAIITNKDTGHEVKHNDDLTIVNSTCSRIIRPTPWTLLMLASGNNSNTNNSNTTSSTASTVLGKNNRNSFSTKTRWLVLK